MKKNSWKQDFMTKNKKSSNGSSRSKTTTSHVPSSSFSSNVLDEIWHISNKPSWTVPLFRLFASKSSLQKEEMWKSESKVYITRPDNVFNCFQFWSVIAWTSQLSLVSVCVFSEWHLIWWRLQDFWPLSSIDCSVWSKGINLVLRQSETAFRTHFHFNRMLQRDCRQVGLNWVQDKVNTNYKSRVSEDQV